MRTLKFVAVLASMVAFWEASALAQQEASNDTGGGSACIPECESACRCCGDDAAACWTVRSNAVFLSRSNPHSQVLVSDSFAPGGTTLLNADQFHMGSASGWDIYLAREHVFGEWGVEASYFRIDGWNASIAPMLSPDGGVVQFATPIGNPFFPSTIAASYESQLYSVEVNARRPLTDKLSLVAGFRFLELTENGLAITQDIGPGLNTANYGIHAHNSLPGFQLGLDDRIRIAERLVIQAVGKAGVYANHASNTASLTQQVGPSFHCDAEETQTAFVGELDFAGIYEITRHLSLRGGYELVWLDGVATASDQVRVSDPAFGTGSVASHEGLFYHGAFIGLEFRR